MARPYQGAAAELSDQRWGGRSRPIESNPVAAVSSTESLAGNADRVALLLQNIGSYPVYVGFGQPVSATNGLLVAAAGGTLSLSLEEDGETTSRSLYTLADGGTSQLYILETVVQRRTGESA